MNILVLTSVYRDDSLGNRANATNIVNSFVTEWEKQGHNVLVIHNSHCYPKFIHDIPIAIKEKLATKMGFPIADYEAVNKKAFKDNGADIYRIPIKKMIPHRMPSMRAINRQVKSILGILETSNFKPDVMIGHWASPQMEIMYELAEKLHCPSAIVLHGTGYINNPKFETKKYLSRITKVGCRSKTQAEIVREMLNLDVTPFVCYSGVPDAYLEQFQFAPEKFSDTKVWKFVYAGRLVGYKSIDVIIRALSSIKDHEWQLDIIGEGAEGENLQQTARDCNCADRVIFHGRVLRDEVVRLMSDAHCFVMVSKDEIFGLVYLEAMAASCITIGSKREGIDGVLVDGENGYLCEPADEEALTAVLREIMDSNVSTNCTIAEHGYVTAKKFSDTKVAQMYLDAVIK